MGKTAWAIHPWTDRLRRDGLSRPYDNSSRFPVGEHTRARGRNAALKGVAMRGAAATKGGLTPDDTKAGDRLTSCTQNGEWRSGGAHLEHLGNHLTQAHLDPLLERGEAAGTAST